MIKIFVVRTRSPTMVVTVPSKGFVKIVLLVLVRTVVGVVMIVDDYDEENAFGGTTKDDDDDVAVVCRFYKIIVNMLLTVREKQTYSKIKIKTSFYLIKLSISYFIYI